MDIARSLRQRRIEKELSQFDVAHLAKVSLATVQNIEAGRANPAWETVQALLKVLGLELRVRTKNVDWAQLARLGCPLLVEQPEQTFMAKSREILLSSLENLSDHIEGQKVGTRESKAVLAWFSALRDHYPSIWLEARPPIKMWFKKNGKKEISPKLRRLALSQLAEFL